jgi:sulfur-oxidizing protein SoxX
MLMISLAAMVGRAGAARAEEAGNGERLEAEVKEIVSDSRRGNCLACHQIAGSELAGNIGPPLAGMKARYPDKAKLRAQIFDPRTANPDTVMPPFGQHRILSPEEIDILTDYIHNL